MNAIHLLDRILDPVAEAFSPEVAQRVLETRIDELAAKSTRGDLSDEERAEYKSYVEVIDLISVLQAKALRVVELAD